MSPHRYGTVSLVALGMLLFIGTAQASAGAVEDIPNALADAIGVSVSAAELILSTALMLSAGLTLSVMRRGNMATTSIVMLAMLGMLTAIGWLDGWLLVMVALILALIFGSRLRDWGDQAFRKEG